VLDAFSKLSKRLDKVLRTDRSGGDNEKMIWTVPAERMKSGVEHRAMPGSLLKSFERRDG
jgi:hypothetical protein